MLMKMKKYTLGYRKQRPALFKSKVSIKNKALAKDG